MNILDKPFHELSFDELERLRKYCLSLLHKSYVKIKKFNSDNNEFVSNHESGNWYDWKYKIEDEIKKNDFYLLKMVEHLNKGEYKYADGYFHNVKEIVIGDYYNIPTSDIINKINKYLASITKT